MVGHPDLPVPVLHLVARRSLSIGLSFTNWQGFGALTEQELHRPEELPTLFTAYPFFWPAVWHNIMWLLTFVFIATPIGIFFAVLLDREMRGTRFYQSAFFIPVVLSLALIGFIWQLMYSADGFINSVLGRTGGQRHRLARRPVDSTSGPPSWRPAGATSATSWSSTWRD